MSNDDVRRALLAANLVSNKVTDGIARLLQKTDVAALTRREMASKITALETAMKEVSKCAVSLVLQEAIATRAGGSTSGVCSTSAGRAKRVSRIASSQI